MLLTCLAVLLLAVEWPFCHQERTRVTGREPPKLVVQLDFPDLHETNLPVRLSQIRAAGADGLLLAMSEFFKDGAARQRDLDRLRRAIAYFERAGLRVAVWPTSLGYGGEDNADIRRRFPNRQKLVAYTGKTGARCPTDAACRQAVCDNVRDFIRAGAKTIVWDDDLVQTCRPGLGCVCPEHLRRVSARLGRPVSAADVERSFSGASNDVRTAFLDVTGETLTDYCRSLRAAADAVDPDVTMGLCLSWTHYDCEGLDVLPLARLLAGKGHHPLVRVSGATYWPVRSMRCRGLHLGSVIEFVRWQIAKFRGTDVTLLDENDPEPRDSSVVPAELVELYDKAMIAEGGITRNKYILRRCGKSVDPAYLRAHLANRPGDAALAARFSDAGPCGFKVIFPEHQIRAARIPGSAGMWRTMKEFALPMPGILLAFRGVPTHYDVTADTPAIAFGQAAEAVTAADCRRGVILDAEGARILSARGIDVGTPDGREWRLYRNAAGGRFAVLDKDAWDLEFSVADSRKVPADRIWRFFTGEDLPVEVSDPSDGVYLIAKRRPSGERVVLLCNMRGEKTGRFVVRFGGRETEHELPAYGFKHLSSADGHRPETWFHVIGGNATAEGLTADLEAIKAAGYGGIQFFHGNGDAWDGVPEQVPCLSAKWDGLVRHVAEECRRLDLGFRMQNCPGWSTSGGPWIRPSEAMRRLVFAQKTVTGGPVPEVDVPAACRDADSDWRDVALLAYPTPVGNGGRELKPDAVTGEGTVRTFSFARPVTVRTVVLPWPRALHRDWPYNPATHVKVEAGTPEGWRTVRETDYPQGCWQDGVPMSVACAAAEAKTWRVTLTSPHAIRLDFVRLYADRFGDNWEGRSALTLRGDLTGEVTAALPEETVDRAAVRVVRVGDVLPDGRWTLLRVGHVNMKLVNSPAPREATGWECDKLDPRGVEANFRGYVGRLAAGPLAGGLLRGMVVDSWECRRQTWTWRMEDYFRQAAGYDLRPMLPALNGAVVGSSRETDAFLLDWRRTIGGLVTRNYYGRMAELAHVAGLDVAYETSFGDVAVGDPLEYWKHCDTPMCEFWQPLSLETGGVGHPNFKPVRPCVSAAHLYGKRRVAAEAFTSMNLSWNENFRDLKAQAVRHYARGVTHLVTHTFTHNPHVDGRRPGTSFGSRIGTPFVRGQPWWSYMPSFLVWMAECGAFLERGLPVVDVLRYLGDDVGHRPDELEPFSSGHACDYLNRDVLFGRLAVRDGRFVLPDGLSYSRIWIPTGTYLLPETEKRLAELTAQGGTVVRGTAADAVAGLAPQVVSEGAGDLLWYHRRETGKDLYFLAAETNGFRGTVALRTPKGVTRVELDLAPAETRLLTLDGEPAAAEDVSNSACRELTEWNVSFPSGWGAPPSLDLHRLVAWKDLPGVSEEGRSFSGTATYSTSWKLKRVPDRLELDLGEVKDFARVFVNGKEVSALWAKPYRCDITPFVRPGENELRLDVTSTWYNRLAYDFNRPPSERKTWTVWDIPTCPPPCLTKGARPLESGLMGPVRLLATAFRRARKSPSVHTAKVFSQIVFGDLTDANRARYLEDAKAAGVDCVFLSFGDYFQIGEPRRRFFERLAREIRFFETNGLAVAVWMNGFGYGNARTGTAARWLEGNPTLTAFSGRRSGASCPTGSPIRRGLVENARDIARAGARMILVDDDFVQSVRPGICCVCANHLARYAARVGRPVTTNDVCRAFTGKPNDLRRAVLDVSGEIAMGLAREMRATVDGIDPSIGMGLCASYTHWDVEGVDLERLLSVFAGRNRRFFRVSGAPYWGPKFPGQGLDSVCEFVRQQAAWCRTLDNTTVFDENDPYPRKVASVPAWKCELYDKVTLADGVLGRHKYMLCYGADRSEPGYLEAHLANRPDDAKLSALFAGTESFGVRALFPRQSIRSAVLPVPYRGDRPLMTRYSMAFASTFLVRNGLPVRHEGRGVSLVFGQAALGVKPADLEDGLVVDREAADVLRRRGIDPSGPRVRTLDIDGCEQDFGACRSRPQREAILRAVRDLSGRALAVRLAADAKDVYPVVRYDPARGEYALLLENLSDVPVDVTVETDGRPKTVGSLRGNFREEPSGLVLPDLAPHGYAAVRFRLNR